MKHLFILFLGAGFFIAGCSSNDTGQLSEGNKQSIEEKAISDVEKKIEENKQKEREERESIIDTRAMGEGKGVDQELINKFVHVGDTFTSDDELILKLTGGYTTTASHNDIVSEELDYDQFLVLEFKVSNLRDEETLLLYTDFSGITDEDELIETEPFYDTYTQEEDFNGLELQGGENGTLRIAFDVPESDFYVVKFDEVSNFNGKETLIYVKPS